MQISEDTFLIVALLVQIVLSIFSIFLVLRAFKWAKGRQLFFQGVFIIAATQISFFSTWALLFSIEFVGMKPFPVFILLQMWMVIFTNTPVGAGVLTIFKLLRSDKTIQSVPNVWLVSLCIYSLSCLIMFSVILIFGLTLGTHFPEQEFKGE